MQVANVLNLVISGIPSIREALIPMYEKYGVLNLVISGIPSIRFLVGWCFSITKVLNLVISGIPSILGEEEFDFYTTV